MNEEVQMYIADANERMEKVIAYLEEELTSEITDKSIS